MKKLILLITVAFMAVCCNGMAQNKKVTGSKNYITKTLDNPSAFDRIEIKGSPDVEYRQSTNGTTAISLYGPDNLVELLEVEIRNNTMHVKFKDGYSIQNRGPLKVIATSPDLKSAKIVGSGDFILAGTLQTDKLSLDVTGSGDITAQSVEVSKLNINVNGSGDVECKTVTTDKIEAKVNGSGDIDILGGTAVSAVFEVNRSGDITAGKLTAEQVSARVDGSGDIVCRATQEIEASVSGSGDIEYYGNPSVKNFSGKTKSITAK